jgi:hypothetical protein
MGIYCDTDHVCALDYIYQMEKIAITYICRTCKNNTGLVTQCIDVNMDEKKPSRRKRRGWGLSSGQVE